jgi:hypothetical protein
VTRAQAIEDDIIPGVSFLDFQILHRMRMMMDLAALSNLKFRVNKLH